MLYNTLLMRRNELCGYRATDDERSRLCELLTISKGCEIDLIYSDFPICGVEWEYYRCDGGRSQDAAIDPEAHHRFQWLNPTMIADEIEQGLGRAALESRFVRIADCAIGGDGYFIQMGQHGNVEAPLYRVYYDLIDPCVSTPLPCEAVRWVSPSFADVIRRATIIGAIPRIA